MVAVEDQVLVLAGSLVQPGKMQKELQAVHFPHMLRAAEAVAADVNLVREALRELLAGRHVQMPVDILKNIHLRFKDRVKAMRILVQDYPAIWFCKRIVALVDPNPVEHVGPEPLTDTVDDFANRKRPYSFDIPR